MSQKVNITSPVGRIVMGSLYDPNTTDMDGAPLVVKTGPNKGQPRVNYFFALAIPKGPEPHWAHTAWGQQIWNIGNQAHPQQAQLGGYSWKVIDGDDATPSMKSKPPGKKPCDNEGFKGHWVLRFSGSFAPKIYRQEGAGYVQIMEKDFVKPGYFVEVAFSVEGNGPSQSPGVYLNHSMVCFRAYGPEITFGPDVASAGFGAAPLPVGASMTPPPSSVPMPQAQAAAPAAYMLPPVPQAPQGVPHIPGVAPAPLPPGGSVPGAPAPIPVMPNTGFIQMPPPVAAVPPPPVPQAPAAAPVGRQMTAAANGVTYEAYRAANWTDAQLVQNGLMVA